MLTARAGSAAGVVAADRIIVVGGEGNRGRSDGLFVETEAYRPAADAGERSRPCSSRATARALPASPASSTWPGGATREGFGAVATNEALDPAF